MNKTKDPTTTNRHDASSTPFQQRIANLPTALKKKFLAYVFASILVAILITIAFFTFMDVRLFAGLLILLYLLYMGMDIVWAFESGKIKHKKVVCFNAVKHPIMNCLHVIFQEYGISTPSEENVYEFYVPNNKKNRTIFISGAVADIYFRPDVPYELTAWTILGAVLDRK